ncbi:MULTISPECIES: TetR/AcrR family transcriptional regulator [Cohnella]|uniref:TetR/AcrR family transcriptional regulator n=1 Tax=Cohnella TaxID=329857 RepID=UPI001592D978|nr:MULTISPECIES: TetR/AcrR family transcriptional regulator [Cohnella]MBN2984534.1 TetR/AcrR family transcriptional regulator [Cohnella algarum]
MIVQTTLRLLKEVGPSVTTLQIARAAGISEPTIFRAFADKQEVLEASLEEATKPEHIAIELEAIDLEAGLEERLTKLIETMRDHSERTGAILNAIRLASPSGPKVPGPRAEELQRRWFERYKVIHASVCKILEPDEPRLRLPVAEMASAVLAIVLSIGRTGGSNSGLPVVTSKQLTDLILHGALK